MVDEWWGVGGVGWLKVVKVNGRSARGNARQEGAHEGAHEGANDSWDVESEHTRDRVSTYQVE